MKPAVKKSRIPEHLRPLLLPSRFDAAGHALLRFIQRRSDRIPDYVENMRGVEALLMSSLRDAVFISRESRKLSTWRILDDVIISVDEGGTVTTVHPHKEVP